jgi:hypothetical protein
MVLLNLVFVGLLHCIACYLHLFMFFPLTVVFWYPIAGCLALVYCALTARPPTDLVISMKQSIDFTVRIVTLSMLPTWDISYSLGDDDLSPAKRRKRAKLNPQRRTSPFFRWVRLVVAFGIFVVLQLALPVFDTVTDTLFFFQMYNRQQQPLPPTEVGYFAIMVILSASATAVNGFAHIVALLYVAWRFIQIARGRTTFAAMIFSYAPFLAPMHRRGTPKSDRLQQLPFLLQLIRFVKLFLGDALHVVVSCLCVPARGARRRRPGGPGSGGG